MIEEFPSSMLRKQKEHELLAGMRREVSNICRVLVPGRQKFFASGICNTSCMNAGLEGTYVA